MASAKKLIVVVGPTAVGKTSVAIQLANHYNCPIISADSRQFYKEISIGTAKPNSAELAKAEHHFVDFLALEDSYSAGQFEKDGMSYLENHFKEHDVCVCAGGSGLYVNAIIYGLDDLPSSLEIRKKIIQQYEEEGINALQRELETLDPEYYNSMDVNNKQRLIRAIEVCKVSGKKYSDLRTRTSKKRPFEVILIGLTRSREAIYSRINLRVDAMLKKGLLEEVKNVFNKRQLNSLQAVGYSEFFRFLEGQYGMEEAIRLVKRNTRRFAKRQLTWFNKYEGIQWFEPEKVEEIKSYIESQ